MDSISELAHRLGVRPQSVYQVLSGARSGRKALAKIAEITGVSVHWLRDGSPIDAPSWAAGGSNRVAEGVESYRVQLQPDQLGPVGLAILAELRALRRDLARSQLLPADLGDKLRAIEEIVT